MRPRQCEIDKWNILGVILVEKNVYSNSNSREDLFSDSEFKCGIMYVKYNHICNVSGWRFGNFTCFWYCRWLDQRARPWRCGCRQRNEVTFTGSWLEFRNIIVNFFELPVWKFWRIDSSLVGFSNRFIVVDLCRRCRRQ